MRELKYPLGSWFEKFGPAATRFIRGLLAEVLAAGIAYFGNYLIKNPTVWAGVFVGLGPLLQSLSKKIRDERSVSLPL